MSTQRPVLFPIFLKLNAKPCLVVGGGPIAEGKVESLLRSGARVTVVSPEVTSALAERVCDNALCWKARTFELADLDGVFLVVAATSSFEANGAIYHEADRRGVLCNAVDQPEQCHFYYPAVVDRGPLQIAISTAGLESVARSHYKGPGDPVWTRVRALGRVARKSSRNSDAPRQRLRNPPTRARNSRQPANLRAFTGRPGTQIVAGRGRRMSARVYLVGGGSGNPDLLTVKAVRVLRSADIVLHDALVTEEILQIAQPHAQLIDVGKRVGDKRLTQDAINHLLIDLSGCANVVVQS